MKICEVCVYFEDPIRLYEDHGTNIYKRHPAGEERFILDPCNDVVQGPGRVQEDRADGQPPAVDGGVEKDEEAVPDTEDQLCPRSATT